MYRYSFDAVDATLQGMQAKNARLTMVKEQLDSEIVGWLANWDGDALNAAQDWSRRVSSALGEAIDASRRYVTTATNANNDMRVREQTTTATWV